MHYLFVTGLHRSGTTLLEKLLHNHPQAAVASQPAPLLYYHLKNIFLQQRGLQRLYPIDPLFGEQQYSPADFTAFLRQYHLSVPELQELAAKMEGYEGQYSPDLLPAISRLVPGPFEHVYRQLCDLTAQQSPDKQVLYRGTKEIMAEEFMPVLLAAGVKVLLIIRDPRGMLASTNTGRELGQIRPTLFYLLQWRKSVAFSLALAQHPGFHCITYEQLVSEPERQLQQLADFLQLPPFPAKMLQEPLQHQRGSSWQGNSAFEPFAGISTASAHRFRKELSQDAIRFTEAFCAPEIRHLGYPLLTLQPADLSEALLAAQREPFAVTHRHFPADYSHAAENLQAEQHRLRLLRQPGSASAEEIKRWFIFPEAFEKLRAEM